MNAFHITVQRDKEVIADRHVRAASLTDAMSKGLVIARRLGGTSFTTQAV